MAKKIDLNGLSYFKGKENECIATVEDSSTASKAYVVGDRFYFKGKLCICTADIASGGTITIGTNCTVDSLGDDVTALCNYVESAFVTEDLNVTSNGITVKNNNGNLKMYGTASALRRFLFLNGLDGVKNTANAFAETLPAGTYLISLTVTGTRTSARIDASYSTFSNYFKLVTGPSESKVVTFTAPVMIGVHAPENANFGTSDNPTNIVFSAKRITVEDVYARGLINEIGADTETIERILSFDDSVSLPFSLPGKKRYVKYADGTIDSNDNYCATNYIDVSMFSSLQYKKTCSTSATPIAGMAFYDADKTYISGISSEPSQEATGYLTGYETVAVPDNAVYARFSTLLDTDTYGTFSVYGLSKLKDAVDYKKNYVKSEADRVAEKVRNVQNGDTISFAAISDMHYKDGDDTIRKALEDMRDGVLAIADQVHLDFYADFGDAIWRLNTDGDFDTGKKEMIAITKLVSECFGNNKQIRMVGNHDPNSEGATGYFTAYQMYSYTGIYSDIEKPNYAGWGYLDLEKQKIRIIVLNTSFYSQSSTPTQGATTYKFGASEQLWLAQTLDISDKEDAEDWQIIVFSHVALDKEDSSQLAVATKVLYCYEKGIAWSGSGNSYDFTGKNVAKLACYVSGHWHKYGFRNFRFMISDGTIQDTIKLPVMFVPNALPDREEESVDGVTYAKTAETAESTAFQIITVDPTNKIVYAHHYGAGIDVIMHYASQAVTSATALTSSLTSPSWNSMNTSVATVSDGSVTPVADGNTMIWCKSTTDNCIEAWNISVDI